MNLPVEYQKKMKKLLGESYEDYFACFADRYGQTLRVNRLKTTPADFFRRFVCRKEGEEILFRPIPWCGDGFYYEGKGRLSLHPYYYGGVYYLQEPSAMAPAAFLPVEPGDKVLDLCAAPGGKATALAAKLNGEGILVANDVSSSRCRALLKNIEMAGAANAVVVCEKPDKLAERFEAYFDKILIDAPCSGEGMFRKDPAMMKSWSPDEVRRYARLQKEILRRGARMLKAGGKLLYSTCTYSPEENEQVVESLLSEDPRFSLLPLPEYEGLDTGHAEWGVGKEGSLKYCRRFWNHRVKGEGQFAALFEKSAEASSSPQARQPGTRGQNAAGQTASGKMTKEMEAFFSHCHMRLPEDRIRYLGERAFLVPAGLPELGGIRVVSSGLHLGDCRKKRFEPGHALAMALKPDQYDNVLRLRPEDMRVEKYLRCETIEAEGADGWALVCADEFPLGWGKIKNGVVKNKYPAGWRKGR